MKFRDMEIDKVVVIGPLVEKDFLKKLKELYNKYIVIDLQYSTQRREPDLINRTYVNHCALVLVRKKHRRKPLPTPKPTKGIMTNGG